MELRQLEYFVAVVEEGSFTRAAQRVRISQSGVSAQIRQLEHEVGALLIDRSGRTATVTTAGAAALGHARRALSSVEALRTAVGEVSGLVRGRLVVGMVTACTVTPLFDALESFHTAHPGVEIALLEDGSDRLVEQVRAGAVDLALIGACGAPPADLAALPIVSEPLVAAAPPDHPLVAGPAPDGPACAGPAPRRRQVTLRDLAAFPVVCLPEGTGIRTVFDRACAARDVRPAIALQASAPAAVADLALRGLGVAVLSRSMLAGYDGRLVAVPIEDADEPAVLALVWSAGSPGPALRGVLPHARAAFGTGAPPPGTVRAR